MEKTKGIYKAHSPNKKVVLIDYNGDEIWSKATEAVLKVLSESKIIKKGDMVEVTFGDESKGEEKTIVFLKSVEQGFDSKGFVKKQESGSFGYRNEETQLQIMRQNAMNRVVDLVCADRVEFDKMTMLKLAEAFVHYFKTGTFEE